MSIETGSKAFHGGAFYEMIGTRFDGLDQLHDCINADVLDAWFDPSPLAIKKLEEYLPWFAKTSPPTHCEGLVETISNVMGIPRNSILPGAGSSDLIFLSMLQLLHKGSRVLILDPTYGEYRHVFEQVVKCNCHSFALRRDEGYTVDLSQLTSVIQKGNYDLVVLVNPNSPTGTFLSKAEMVDLIQQAPLSTMLWVDETYIDYVDKGESLEEYAVQRPNLIVCKSLSKILALSGLRSAYLVSNPELVARLATYTPPWAVSLPAQVATIAALEDQDYYRQRYEDTRRFRVSLASGLEGCGIKTYRSVANFILAELPELAGDAKSFVAACRSQGLYLRDVSSMGQNLSERMFRIAVKSGATNARMILEIRRAIGAL